MRHRLWGVDPRSAAAVLAAQAEQLSAQIGPLEALLRAERARTADLRRRQIEQAEAITRAEADLLSLRQKLDAAAAEVEERRRALDPATDPEVAAQEERIASLRRKVEKARQQRAGLIRAVRRELLQTEAGGETDASED